MARVTCYCWRCGVDREVEETVRPIFDMTIKHARCLACSAPVGEAARDAYVDFVRRVLKGRPVLVKTRKKWKVT